MTWIFEHCKSSVDNRGRAPDSFLNELIDWARGAPDEVFARNDKTDIYCNLVEELGPYQDLLHRRAVMCECLRVLGGFESSWRWDAGRDLSANNTGPCVEEAGIFQCSGNSLGFDRSLKQLFERHAGEPATASEETCRRFMALTKSDHTYALEHCARLLRFTVNHHGPVKRRTVNKWVKREAVAEFRRFLAEDAAPEVAEPPVEPGLASLLNSLGVLPGAAAVLAGNGTVQEGPKPRLLVRAIQLALAVQGISVGIDGVFGPNTVAAVQQFQRAADLTNDSVVGKNTLSRLIAATKAVYDRIQAFTPGERFAAGSILIVGDSQAENLRYAFGRLHAAVSTSGHPGASSVALVRWLAEDTSVAKNKSLVILHAGGNDLDIGYTGQQIAWSLEAMALLAARSMPRARIVLATIPPRGEYFDALPAGVCLRREKAFAAVNGWILAGGHGFAGFDTSEVLGDPTDRRYQAADFRVSTQPNVHFNARAYDALARAYLDRFAAHDT